MFIHLRLSDDLAIASFNTCPLNPLSAAGNQEEGGIPN